MIIIVGDSWGVGEWDGQCNLSGPGIGQYLMLHDRVVNLSVGSGSNTQSLDRLQDFLGQYQVSAYDTIYWVVTCPSRCSDGPQSFVESDMSILDHARDLLYCALDRGNKIAEQYQTRLQLIGGICDLDWLDVTVWKNISIRVPSWSQLIAPDHPSGIIDPVWWPDLGVMLKRSRPEKMHEWLDISETILRRQKSWNKIFPTDGNHPDKHGHLLLRNHLYPEWHWKI